MPPLNLLRTSRRLLSSCNKRLRPRLAIEPLEDRRLLSVAVNLTISTDPWEDFGLIERSIERAADLSRYSDEQLDATTDWAVTLVAGAQSPDSAGYTSSDQNPWLFDSAGSVLSDGLPSHDSSNFGRVSFAADVSWQSAVAQLESRDDIEYFFPLVRLQRSTRFIPNDPYFGDQWHLRNTGQTGGTPGADANVVPAWDTAQGRGVVIGIVDDGIQFTHPDLSARYRADLSFDFLDNDADPSPVIANDDFHGTSVAGVAAAAGNNGTGVSGSAPQAELAALRLISFPGPTDAQEAAALSHEREQIDIYNNSWGPALTGVAVEPGPLVKQAFLDGVNLGRGGLGSIYVWAAGNGLRDNENVNYDGFANSRFTIAVTAIDERGRQSFYAEPGASILIAAPSLGDGAGIVTTDLVGADGYNFVPGNGDDDPFPDLDYTGEFSGTSSSAPLVSGVIALMLETNPNLGWREVQQILVETASQNDPGDNDWRTNGAGRLVNHKYGFGAIDAAAAVAAAVSWPTAIPITAATTGRLTVGAAIPDNNTNGVSDTVDVQDDLINIEWVEVVFDVNHSYAGDLRVVLTSPAGTRSVLAEQHFSLIPQPGYNNWTFTTARHWGESTLGDWTLSVSDEEAVDVGTWNSWQLNFYTTDQELLIAVDDFAVTRPGSSIDIPILQNDVGNVIPNTVMIITPPANGSAIVNPATGIVLYTPNPGFFGIDTFIYTVGDGATTSNEATVTINVKNDPPVALADSYTIIEGSSISIGATAGLLANDFDPEDDPLTAMLVVAPTNGSLSLGADGSFSYLADPGFFGTDQFTYVANDGLLDSQPATVSIRINAPPQANPDVAETDEDVAVAIDILDNDVDPDGFIDPASVTIIDGPTNGQIIDINPATGVITYLSSPEFFGSDTISYTIRDNDGATSGVATIDITIHFVNDPTVVVDDIGVTDIDHSVVIRVLENDSDIDTEILLDSITIVDGPQRGVAVANSDGTVTYTPNSGFAGGDVFTYQVEDSLGVTSETATVTIRVGDPVTISGFVYIDFDNDLVRELDDGDLPFEGVTIRIEKIDDPLRFSVTLLTDAAGFYQLVETPGVDVIPAGVYEITQVQPAFLIDGGDSAGSGQSNPPDNPVLVTNDKISNVMIGPGGAATEFNFAELGLQAEFVVQFLSGRVFLASSGDGGVFASGTLSLPPIDLSKGPALISFDEGLDGIIRASGKLASAPGAVPGIVTFEWLDENASLISSSTSSGDTLTLAASAAPGEPRFLRVSGTDTNLSLSFVGGVVDDELPRAALAHVSHITQRSDTQQLISVSFSDNVAIDPASIDLADIRVTGPNGFEVLAVAVAPTGVVPGSSLQVDYTIAAPGGTWDFPDSGNYSIWLEPGQVSDISGNSVAAIYLGEFGVSIKRAAPLARDDRFEVGEDGSISRSAAAGMLANDTAGDFGPIDELSIIVPPAHGSLSYQLDGSFTYRPHPDFYGVDSFVYQAHVGSLAVNPATVTIDVQAIDDAPRAVGETLFVDEDGRLEFGSDVLLEAGADWKYLADGSDQGDAWRQPLFDDALWNVGASELGYGDGDEATVVGFDGDNKPLTTYYRRSFAVRDVASIDQLTLHVLRDDGAVVFLNGVEIVRDNVPFDADFDTPASADTTGDDERVFHIFAINPDLLVEGKNLLAIEIHQFSADSPDLSMDARLTAVRLGPSGVLSNDVDVDGDSLIVILTTPPRRGTLTLQPGGSFVYVPEPDFAGSDRFRYRVSDGNQQSNIVTATIVVRPVNDPPVAEDDFFSTEAGRPLTVDISTFSAAQDSQQVLIAAGEMWAFLDDGTDQQTEWIFSDFDDSSWSVGRGEFGYGDGDETTLIDYGGDPNNKYTTTYFRHTFFVDAAAIGATGSLEMRLLRDDGAAVYLNGTEIVRHRLAENATYDTFAVPKSRGEEERTFHVVSVDHSLLVAGENTIAVEIHQHDLDTSDMSFDLMLSRSFIGLLGNDRDAENDPLAAYLVDQPTGGTVDLFPDGTFTYIPNPGFAGVDTFTYVANDGTSDSNVATVTITVLGLASSADLTGNGFVDFEDLTVLLAHWNQNVSSSSGNLVDPLGTPVDFEDLTVLLAAWTGPGPAGAPVGRRLAAAVGGDGVGDIGESVAVGDASYKQAPQQSAVDHNDTGATDSAFDQLGREASSRRARRPQTSTALNSRPPLRRLQATAVDRAFVGEEREASFGTRRLRTARRR